MLFSRLRKRILAVRRMPDRLVLDSVMVIGTRAGESASLLLAIVDRVARTLVVTML